MHRIALLVTVALMGCGNNGKDSGDVEPTPDLTMTDANNYSYVGKFTIDEVAVAAESDSSVDWCGITTDIRDRPVDPNLVDRMILIELELTQAEAVEAIEKNELTQEDTVTQWILPNEDDQVCTGNLSDFNIIGNFFNPEEFVHSSNTWLLSAAYFVDSRFDFLMNKFVVPTDGETNTSIVMGDSCADLDFTTDLHTLTPLVTSASFDSYTFDWSAVTNDVNGNPFDDEAGNQLLIGKVAMDKIEDVEEIFLRVDTEAEELYRLQSDADGVPIVYGETDADLMLATDEAGNTFPGFTTDGIWLLGVECTTCTSPAPLLLTVVDVVE